jgi:Raf kinase inhibitor-like YbhB/YbcL family protein
MQTRGIRSKDAAAALGGRVIFCFCCIGAVASSMAAEKMERQSMQLVSTAFALGESIPALHTCTGKNISPALKWSGVPEGAKSLALIADDPDAPVGTWVHWVLYDLPPATKELPEDLPKSQYIPGGGAQGLNDFKHLGYGGPCPPPGKPHRYFFKLYALDTMLELKPGATKKAVEKAMETHVLAQGELMGTYKR